MKLVVLTLVVLFHQYDSKMALPTTVNGQEKLLRERHKTTSKETKVPLVLTKSQSLLNISKVARKHWNALSINKAFKEILQNELVTAFRRNKN